MLLSRDDYVVLFILYFSSEDEDEVEFFDVDEFYDLEFVSLRLVVDFFLFNNNIVFMKY